jgi:DNA-binding transcriptional LysR family regulator
MAVDLKVRDLELTVLLSETLNVNVVAKTLGMSQPGVTKRLKDIERHVRAKLFERDHSKMSITSRGRHFVKHARDSVASYRRAMVPVQTDLDRDESALRVGKSPYIDPDIIAVLNAIELPLFPRLRLESSTEYSCESVLSLIEKNIDIALVISPPKIGRITLVSLRRSPFLIAMRDDHPLASKQGLSLDDIGTYPWVFLNRQAHPLLHEAILNRMKDLGIPPRITHSILNAEESLPYISNSDAIAWWTPYGAALVGRPDVVVLPFRDERIVLETYIATRAEERSPLVSEFVRAFMKKLKQVSSIPIP